MCSRIKMQPGSWCHRSQIDAFPVGKGGICGNHDFTTGTARQAETISGILTNSNFVSGRGGKRCHQREVSWFCLHISLFQLIEFMFDVKSTDNKNITGNIYTLFVFFCQHVKSPRRFSAVSSRSCSKWASNGSPLPVVRNQKLKATGVKLITNGMSENKLVETCCYCFLTHCWIPKIRRCQYYLQNKERNDNCFLNLSSVILKSTLPHFASWDFF